MNTSVGVGGKGQGGWVCEWVGVCAWVAMGSDEGYHLSSVRPSVQAGGG